MLVIKEVFPTIQGEGIYAGRPAVFVRLAGCNLQCPGCDTNYTEGTSEWMFKDLLAEVDGLAYEYKQSIKLVVITGGEPFNQNFSLFANGLLWRGYDVQVETNGSYLHREFPKSTLEQIEIVCSPKGAINEDLEHFIDAYKYILREGEIDELDGLPTSSLYYKKRPGRPRHRNRRVFVQPMDEQDETKNKQNVRVACQSAMKFGYYLSVQMHKLVGMP